MTTNVPTITHAYATSGSYTATLTVTDSEGCSTAVIFTGHSVTRNGSSAAQTARTISIVPTIVGLPATVKIISGAATLRGCEVKLELSCTGSAGDRYAGTLALSVKLNRSGKTQLKQAGTHGLRVTATATLASRRSTTRTTTLKP